MWWVTSGDGSSSPAASSASTGSRWRDHVGHGRSRCVSALIQSRPMCTSHALGVDADDATRAALAGQADRQLERAAGRRRPRRATSTPRPSVRALTSARGSCSVRWTGVAPKRCAPSPGARSTVSTAMHLRGAGERARPARRTGRRGRARARPRCRRAGRRPARRRGSRCPSRRRRTARRRRLSPSGTRRSVRFAWGTSALLGLRALEVAEHRRRGRRSASRSHLWKSPRRQKKHVAARDLEAAEHPVADARRA